MGFCEKGDRFARSFHDNEIVIVNVILVLSVFDLPGIGGVSRWGWVT